MSSWLFEVVTGCHNKIDLVASVSAPLFALKLQYEPRKILETANICMLMASFRLNISSFLSQIPAYAITNTTYFES